MGGGKVLESGSHEELLSVANGDYTRLVLAQQIAAAATQVTRTVGSADASLLGSGAVTCHKSTSASEASPDQEKLDSHAFDHIDGFHDLEKAPGTLSSLVFPEEDRVLPYRVIIRRLYLCVKIV